MTYPFRKPYLLCLLAAWGLSGTIDLALAEGPDEILNIGAHKAECLGVGTQLCLLVRKEGQREPELLYQPIAGLEWTWGYRYQVQIRRQKVSSPLEDESAIQLHLVRLLAREPVPADEMFQLSLSSVAPEDGRALITRIGPNLFRFHNEKDFTCASREVCETIAEQVHQGRRLTIAFTYAPRPGDPLIAWRLVRSDPVMKLY